MSRHTIRSLIDLALLAALAGVVGTGVVMDQLDLRGLRLHGQLGYVMAVLAAVHLGFNWRPLVHFVTGPVRRRPARGGRTRIEGSPSAGTAASVEGVRTNVAIVPDGGRPRISRRAALRTALAGTVGLVAGWFGRSATEPVPYEGGDVGLFYHQQSALGVRSLLSNLLDWGRRPAPYKAVGGDPVPLPAVSAAPTMTVATALSERRSRREYADRDLSAAELAWVVRSATAVTSGDGRRVAPSAGALYPIEAYVAVQRVAGIDPGLYHVDVRAQALEPVRRGSVAGELRLASIGQDFVADAPAVLVLTAVFQRSRWKYHQRHYRYACWEAGHIAQNVYLAAEADDLGACVVGAFLDGPLNDLLRIDGGEEAALGLVTIGPRA